MSEKNEGFFYRLFVTGLAVVMVVVLGALFASFLLRVM